MTTIKIPSGSFVIDSFLVKIENGFIPSGKEYASLKAILLERSIYGSKGSFKMQFKNGCFQNAEVLQVIWKTI